MLEQLLPGFTPNNRLLIAAGFGLVIALCFVRIVYKRWRKQSASRPARVKAKTPVSQPATITSRSAGSVQMETKPIYTPPAYRPAAPDVGGTWRGTPIADDSDYVFGAATPSLAELLPESDERKEVVSTTLKNAGYYSAHAWHNLAAIRCLGIVLPILIFGLLLVLVPEPLEPYVIGAMVVFAILGWSLPTIYVRTRAKNRLEEMGRGMPDMLDLLNMCVSQGMTVPTALARVSKELDPVYPALAKELKIVTDQARVGTLDQALRAFSNRVDIPEVHSFTSLLIQTERMGTSMSEALIEHSDNMRESYRQRADEKANAATFKLLFPTVLCLMPAVFMFLLGPATIELNDFFTGRGAEILNATNQGMQMDQAGANGR
ncbi:Bacterial type II secretion system protein F domain protein [Caulifigura coniformis]|uniref:Bacterial type II secretion system protein F domain protein n=1 Tax=Caulifigura coniformis TaxID=2527983 RepID=A0A517SJ78_9PLAN|nr:type II secretion system F family protein [Caulifigura coniformis]QDT56156.1 Bacterial type II secretion system protein F domain protein [Caulifigura coniformis]